MHNSSLEIPEPSADGDEWAAVQAAHEPLTEHQLDGMTAEELLARLAVKAAQARDITAEMAVIVEMARDRGAIWREIGDAAGISATTAYHKWTAQGRQSARDNSRRHYRPSGEDR